MSSKEHPITILEEALKYEESQLQKCQASIKALRSHAHQDEDHAVAFIARISGLKDAIHKLKGLDNLEKKNKIADSAEMTEHQFLRKGPHRTQLKWKDVEDMEILKFIRELILPEIIVLLKENNFYFQNEKENEITDPAHPDYVLSHGIKIGPLYDALHNEAKRRGE